MNNQQLRTPMNNDNGFDYIPVRDQLECAKRTFALLSTLLPNMVEEAKMPAAMAKYELEAFSCIIDTLTWISGHKP